jgi:hypothetical protein
MHVRFSSQEFFNSIGCIPALQLSIFHFANLNVCFSQQRPFRAEENHENDGQLTARSGRLGTTGCKAEDESGVTLLLALDHR